MKQPIIELGKGDPIMSAAQQGTKGQADIQEQLKEEEEKHMNGQGDPLFSASMLLTNATEMQGIKNRNYILHHDQFHSGKADPLFQAVKHHDRIMAIHRPSGCGGKGDPLMKAAMKHSENYGGKCKLL